MRSHHADTHEEKLNDIVEKGLVEDIFRMERAYALLREMGKWATRINEEKSGNFGVLFGALQTALITEAVLATARICDPPHSQYPTRCLKGLLKYLEEHAAKLPAIKQPYQLRLFLQSRSASSELIESIDQSPVEFPSLFLKYIRKELANPEYQDAEKELKRIRDKCMAHNEACVEEISGPTWNALEKMLDLAKYTVGVMGWAYLSTAYVSNNGKYLLSSDAQEASCALSRLMRKVYGKKHRIHHKIFCALSRLMRKVYGER